MVLGMHRSGTSTITRGLQCFGVSLGETLSQAIAGINDKGFWEDIDIVLLNEEILNSLHSTWHDVSEIKDADFTQLIQGAYFQRAVDLINTKTRDTDLFGFKDPRLAKLLPFWKAVLKRCNIEVNYLVVFRNPHSVTNSLVKRDGFDPIKCYLLWLSSMISILGEIGQEPHLLVSYDRLMDAPDHELQRISHQLNLSIVPVEAAKYKTEFLTDELRHNISDISDLISDPDCPALAKDMFMDIDSRAAQNRPLDLEQISGWANEFRQQELALKLIDQLYVQTLANHFNSELEQRYSELNQQYSKLNQQYSELNQRHSELEQQDIQLHQSIEEILSSTCWKITLPLRWLGLFVKRFKART
jgi:hypothetical protein